jgi:ABC-type glutathione transport system ATPase component
MLYSADVNVFSENGEPASDRDVTSTSEPSRREDVDPSRPGSPDLDNAFSDEDDEHDYTAQDEMGRVVRAAQDEMRRAARDRFMNWLSSGEGVFHISGKLGSGKSTLMKYLGDHRRTRAELIKWAGKHSLVYHIRLFANRYGAHTLQTAEIL